MHAAPGLRVAVRFVEAAAEPAAARAACAVVGALVLARYGGGRRAYRARVLAVVAGGARVDLEYEDGDREAAVALDLVRPRGDAAAGAGAGAGAPELPGEPSGLGDARGCWTRLAVPKSASFRWPSRATRTFSALRSR